MVNQANVLQWYVYCVVMVNQAKVYSDMCTVY